MSDHSPEEIKKHVRVYITIFVTLMILTVLTVLASYLQVNLFLAVSIALLIATVKASLVACYFMHLISEKKLISHLLILTSIFFVVCLLLPTIAKHNHINGQEYFKTDFNHLKAGEHHGH